MLNETNLDLHHTILDQAEALRPLPQAVLDLARTVSSPDSGLREVAECLRVDPVLTAVVLREANSAFVGARDAASTVEQAVVRLGGARVLAIAVANSLPSEVNQALPGYGIYEGGLHSHAVASSHAAEVVRSMSSRDLPASLVTAALLHDIGKILLARMLRPQLIPDARLRGEAITTAERALLDLDHAEVGSALVAHWKLPDEIVDGIRFHHEPSMGGPMAHGIAVADQVAHTILNDEIVLAGSDVDQTVLEISAAELGLDTALLVRRVTERLDRAGLLPIPYEEG